MDPILPKLQRLANVTSSVALRNVLNEVYPLRQVITQWNNVPTSGWARCVYDQATGARSYHLAHQWGNLGNLVHELTHVAVNEAYGSDFINYPTNGAADVPARQYTSQGYCANEDARQTKFLNADEILKISSKIVELTAWAQATDLPTQKKADVVSKLSYAAINPQKEYDTVINQILVWLFEWGYPVRGFTKKPVVNALFEEVEKAALQAYNRRQGALAH
ncbi:MAG: hypothetical protein KF894_21800 [Labilithrix sp.]|nr:hypothetical protein [Labilithrix sp.]